jgi:UDP-glucose 4-epimerase
MKIMLTGHRGYIGSHLWSILKKNHELVGFDLKDGQDLLTEPLVEEFDCIIHLAGQSGVRESMKDPGLYWRNNVEVSKRLFERYYDTKILYASSSSVYEPWLNPYASSKHMVELMGEELEQAVGMRFHTVYSDTPRKGMFMQKLLDKQLEYVTGHSRDFIHIDDICNAIIYLLHVEIRGVLDIGTGVSTKISDLAPHLPVEIDTPNERDMTCASTDLMEALGWSPEHDFQEDLTTYKNYSKLAENNLKEVTNGTNPNGG